MIERQSTIDAPADQVWAWVVTAEGINDEVRPWMTMSMPRAIRGLTIDDVPVGVPLGRAWLRLFGVVPFDYDLLTIAETAAGTRLRRAVDHDEHASVAPPALHDTRW